MAKHIFITNTEGGYFYRVYPKLARLKNFSPTSEKSVQRDMFNPPPDYDTHFTLDAIYGKFIQKFNDKGGLTVELFQKGDFVITCLLTGLQERRTLQSRILVVVPEELYRFQYEKNKIYAINIHEVKDITP